MEWSLAPKSLPATSHSHSRIHPLEAQSHFEVLPERELSGRPSGRDDGAGPYRDVRMEHEGPYQPASGRISIRPEDVSAEVTGWQFVCLIRDVSRCGS